jgi:hypothetical protein
MLNRFVRFISALGEPSHRTRRKKRSSCIPRGFRRPHLEQLEDRRLLTITVNTLVDENNGIGAGAGTSLREALFSALAGETIDFSVTGTINLSNLGQLSINKAVVVDGPGADLLTISAYDPTPTSNNGDGSRVFSLDDGNVGTAFNVEIAGLTLTGGDVTGLGGAILNSESLSLRECVVTENFAISGSANQRKGGGIYQSAGDLTIEDCIIHHNSANQGGGVFINAGNLTVLRSTIRDNSASNGGGLFLAGTVAIRDSTIHGNNASGGAGISQLQGELAIENCTISTNIALQDGGGIRSEQGNLTVRNSTLTKNVADSDDNGFGRGGGIFVSASVATLDHVLVAGNLRRVSTREDVFGLVSARFSLIGDGTGATIVALGLNMVGNSAVPVVPLLGPLGDNGGPTQTHALLPGSPAIDLGDPYAMAGVDGLPLYDQRTEAFGRVADGDGQHGPRIDVGAYEFQPAAGLPALLGDYNQDGTVDVADYCVWRDTLGEDDVSPCSGADGDGNGAIGPGDYSVWKSQFGESISPGGTGSIGQESISSVQEKMAIPVALEFPPSVWAETDRQETTTSSPWDWSKPYLEIAVLPRNYNSGDDHGLVAWLTSLECLKKEAEETVLQDASAIEVTPSKVNAYDEGLASLFETTLP